MDKDQHEQMSAYHQLRSNNLDRRMVPIAGGVALLKCRVWARPAPANVEGELAAAVNAAGKELNDTLAVVQTEVCEN